MSKKKATKQTNVTFSDRLREAIRESKFPLYQLTGHGITKRAIYGFVNEGKAIRTDTLDQLLMLIGADGVKLPAPITIRKRLEQATGEASQRPARKSSE